MDYYKKYLKYKKLYLELKQKGGDEKRPLRDITNTSPQKKQRVEKQENKQEEKQEEQPEELMVYPTNQIKSCSDELSNFCIIDTPTDEITNIISQGLAIKGFRLNNQIYVNANLLVNRGSFGQVYKLYNQDRTKDDSYVIKSFKINKKTFYKEAQDRMVYQNYFDEKIKSIILKKIDIMGMVDSYWYEKDRERIILMPGYDGDLIHLIENGLGYNPYKYFKYLVGTIFKLIQEDLYYLDIKLENILYTRNRNITKSIVFGDIGSIIPFTGSPYSKLFISEDLIGSSFSIEGNKIRIYFDDDNYIEKEILNGTNIPKSVLLEVSEDKLKFNTMEIDNDIYLVYNITFSTYPHNKQNYNKCVIINDKNQLINNILNSLGILLIQLVFYQYEEVMVQMHELIINNEINYEEKIDIFKNYIQDNKPYLIELINLLLQKEYIEIENVEEYFNNIINKIDIILKLK